MRTWARGSVGRWGRCNEMVSVDTSVMAEQSERLNELTKVLMSHASEWSKKKGLGKPPSDVSSAVIGFMLAAPFALELALKALYAKHFNNKVPAIHDLMCIMKCLDSGTRKLMEQSFAQERAVRYPEYQDAEITAVRVLTDWRHAFEEWRYLGEGPPPTVHHTREGPLLTDAILKMVSTKEA